MTTYEESIYLSQIEELEAALSEVEKMWREERRKNGRLSRQVDILFKKARSKREVA